jgi:hypothetical protein
MKADSFEAEIAASLKRHRAGNARKAANSKGHSDEPPPAKGLTTAATRPPRRRPSQRP